MSKSCRRSVTSQLECLQFIRERGTTSHRRQSALKQSDCVLDSQVCDSGRPWALCSLQFWTDCALDMCWIPKNLSLHELRFLTITESHLGASADAGICCFKYWIGSVLTRLCHEISPRHMKTARDALLRTPRQMWYPVPNTLYL